VIDCPYSEIQGLNWIEDWLFKWKRLHPLCTFCSTATLLFSRWMISYWKILCFAADFGKQELKTVNAFSLLLIGWCYGRFRSREEIVSSQYWTWNVYRVLLLRYSYTVCDGLTDNTRRYFTSFIVFFAQRVLYPFHWKVSLSVVVALPQNDKQWKLTKQYFIYASTL